MPRNPRLPPHTETTDRNGTHGVGTAHSLGTSLGSVTGDTPSEALISRLTTRQREVLALVASGATNAQVAEALGVSLDGAKWHLREIFARLGVDTREEAANAWRAHSSPAARTRRAAHALLGWITLKAAVVSGAITTVAAGGVVVALVVSSSGGPSSSFAADVAVRGTATGSPAASSTPALYAVVPGDSCAAIAARNGITADALHALNPALDRACTNLVVGQLLAVGAGAATAATIVAVPTVTATPAPPDEQALSLQFNLEKQSPLQDVRVRRALMEAVPNAVITSIDDPRLSGPVSFDPVDARRQLAAAGAPDLNLAVTLLVPDTYDGSPVDAATAAIQAAWQANLGISVSIEVAYAATFMTRVNAGTFDVALFGVAPP